MTWHRSHKPPDPGPVPTTPPAKPPDSKPAYVETDAPVNLSISRDPWRDYVAADRHENVLVSLVDPYPEGRLQAQLDRIEAKLDALLGGARG